MMGDSIQMLEPKNKETRQSSPRPDIQQMALLRDLRQDTIILAQHIKAIRQEMQHKIEVLSETSEKFEEATKKLFEEIMKKIGKDENDKFSEALAFIINKDNTASRKQLFEDIERFMDDNSCKNAKNQKLIIWILSFGILFNLVLTLSFFVFLKG